MAKIDIDKFISHLIKKSSGINQQIFHSDLISAIKEQGLEYKDGEIVKTQRRVAAEAKEAIFDDEDEKIRRELIDYHRSMAAADDYEHEAWISWLEKQKEYESTNFKYVWDRTDCGDLTSALDKYSEEAIINMCHAWYDKGIELERKSWLKKQGQTFTKKDVDDAYLKGVSDAKHELEKQGKQELPESPKDYHDIDPHFGIPVEDLMPKEKTADKVEAKFHEGDWIIHHGTENIYQVVAIIDNQYQLKYGNNYTIQKCADVDKCARLWDITKDARVGDILVDRFSSDRVLILFKGIFEGWILAHCGWNSYELSVREESFGYGNVDYTKYVPATKEQRDLLFAKMEEAGYEWDNVNKNLKKIEQKSAWSKEDEEELSIAIQYLQLEGQYDSINWLKSLKQRLGGQ